MAGRVAGRSATATDAGHASQQTTGEIDFEEIWGHREELRDMCARIVGDTALADDLVQETYLQAFRNIDRLERRGGLMPWLVTVAKRRSLNELRRQRYAVVTDSVPDRTAAVETDPCEVVSVTDEVVRVQAILETLTARERDLLMRQVYGGLSLEELAAEEQSTPASVRSVLSRARAKIKAAIADTGAAALAPVALLGRWLHRRSDGARVRGPIDSPTAPVSYSRVGEIVTAGVASLALGVSSGVVPSPLGQKPNDRPTTVEAAAPEPADGAGGATSDNESATPTDRAAGLGRSSSTDEPSRSARMAHAADPAGAANGVDAVGPTSGEGSGTSGEGESGQGSGEPENPPGTPDPPDPPVEELPVDPDEPLPQADDPDDASYQQFSSPSGSASGDGDPKSEGDGAGGAVPQTDGDGDIHVFALGKVNGKCRVDCMVLFHSTDGGATWEQLEAVGLTGTTLLVPPDYPRDSRLYAAGPAGLQRSVDGGQTFEPLVTASQSGPAAMSPDFSNGDERILIGAPGAAWEYDATTDRSQPVSAAPSSTEGVHFAFTPDHRRSNALFAGALTLDGETTRATIHHCRGKLGDYVCPRSTVLDGLTSTPQIHVSSGYARDELVFAYGEGGALRSTDGAKTFRPVTLPFSKVAAITDAGTSSSEAGTLFAAGWSQGPDGTRGGVARSTDGGLTWALLGADTDLAEGVATVSVLRNGAVLAAPLPSSGGGLLCSADAGTTWHASCPTPTSD